MNTSIINQLKTFGFKWYKDGSTDRVDANMIQEVVDTPNGIKVVYTKESCFESSTAVVEEIRVPEKLDKEWIMVLWSDIKDVRRVVA